MADGDIPILAADDVTVGIERDLDSAMARPLGHHLDVLTGHEGAGDMGMAKPMERDLGYWRPLDEQAKRLGDVSWSPGAKFNSPVVLHLGRLENQPVIVRASQLHTIFSLPRPVLT